MELAKSFGTKLFDGRSSRTEVRELYRSRSTVEARTTRATGLRDHAGADRASRSCSGVPVGVPLRPAAASRRPIDATPDRSLPGPAEAASGRSRSSSRCGSSAIVSAPSDVRGASTATQERAKLEAALAPLLDGTGTVDDRVAGGRQPLGALPTAEQEAIGREYHVLHFIGHGGLRRARRSEGVLAVRGQGRPTGQNETRRQARRRSSTARSRFGWRVLNSCEGARSVPQRPVLERRDEPDRARDPGRDRDAVRDHRPRGDPVLGRVLRGAGGWPSRSMRR